MSLQQKAYRGMGWSSFSGLISNGMELLKYIVLARILSPAEFGLLAMTMVIISIGRIFADSGTSNAVIHFQNQNGKQLSTLFWINIMAGLLLYLVIVVLAPWFAGFYGQPEVSRLLWLAGVILPIYASGALFEVLLRKTLSFNKIAVTEIVAALFGLVVAVTLALDGWGVYALIWSHIVTAFTMTLIFMITGISRWSPSLEFDLAGVRSHLQFGLFQMGERGLNVYGARIDQLIIGRFFGPEILGAYYIAWQIILFPVMRLSPLLNRVAFPVFAGRQNDNPLLRNGYLKLMSGITSMVTPFFLIAGITAPWLVPVLFGSGWELSIQLIPIMALLGFFKMLGNPSGNIVLSKGRADIVFYWNLAVAVLNTLLFLIGAQYSVFVLLWLYTAINLCYFITGQWLMVNRLIELTWFRFMRTLAPFLAALLIPWFGGWLFRNMASGVWKPGNLSGSSNPVTAACHNLKRAWIDHSIWYEQALWGDTVMLISIATLFLILYIPVFWFFQSGLIREFFKALRSS